MFFVALGRKGGTLCLMRSSVSLLAGRKFHMNKFIMECRLTQCRVPTQRSKSSEKLLEDFVQAQRLLDYALRTVRHLREQKHRVLALGQGVAVQVDDGQAQRQQQVGEGEAGLGGLGVQGDEGDEAVPENETFVDLELSQEETVEPLYAEYLQVAQTLRVLLHERFVESQVDFLEEFFEAMRVLLAVEEAVGRVSPEVLHDDFEAEESVAFRHPAKVLAVFVGEAVEDEGCQFVHALAVGYFRVLFEEDVDDAGQAVVVVGLPLVL